ncbi:hypothetical protein A4R43_01115 [Amycolatopsis albispora]|uniref:Uncharacterized protein n=3 Tax=Pseudonocardiaceae TaxID=2070 RepID=A0A229S4B8_9PSEU|nr:hypothetical protein A4R43_01115 [Amycolatopsis albispora]OXM53758.1 hypothetical protein CFP71_21340 [Amycolatopsis thailandensis]
MAQLAGSAAPMGGSNDDLLAQLNAEPEPDPLADVEYTGDVPEDSRRELTALQQGFRDRAKREAERFRLATDSEYWLAICFKSREDKEKFLRNAKLLHVGDKYMDGYAVARLLGVPMDDE